MKVQNIGNNEYQIDGAPIRGYDWQLIRTSHGTYARVAGPSENSDDELFVIEEHDAPERRELWDGLTVMAAAAAARRQVLEDIGEGYTESASDIAAACGKTANWVRVLAPELEREGLAQKAGTSWLFSPQAAEYIQNRPDGRGRKKTQLSADEMAEAIRRDALYLDDHDPGKSERVHVLIWQGHVADRRGEILQTNGHEQNLTGWGRKLDGPAAGFGSGAGAVWVPKKYL